MTNASPVRRPSVKDTTQSTVTPTIPNRTSTPGPAAPTGNAVLKAALAYAREHKDVLAHALQSGVLLSRESRPRPIAIIKLKPLLDSMDRAELLTVRTLMQRNGGLEFYAALAKHYGGNYALAIQKKIGTSTDLNKEQLSLHAFIEQLTIRAVYMNDSDLNTLKEDLDLQDADRDKNATEKESNLQPQRLLAFFGYHAGPLVTGLWGFQMRAFLPIPLNEIKDPAVRARRTVFNDPILVFRGTDGVQVTNREGGVDSIFANFAKDSVGVNQVNANWELITVTLSQVKQAIFAGHSLGGGLAQVVAARRPEKVTQVVTFQAPGVTDEMAARFTEKTDARSTHYRMAGDIVPLSGDTHLPGQIEYLTRFTRARGNPNFRPAVDMTNSHKAFPLTTALQGMNPAELTPEQKAILQYGAHDIQEAGGTQVRVTPSGGVSTTQDPRLKAESGRESILPSLMRGMNYADEMVEANIGYNALLEATQQKLKKVETYAAFKAVWKWVEEVKTVPLSEGQRAVIKSLGIGPTKNLTVPIPIPGRGTGVLDTFNLPIPQLMTPSTLPSVLTKIAARGNQVTIRDPDRSAVLQQFVSHWMSWHPGRDDANGWIARLQKEGVQ